MKNLIRVCSKKKWAASFELCEGRHLNLERPFELCAGGPLGEGHSKGIHVQIRPFISFGNPFSQGLLWELPEKAKKFRCPFHVKLLYWTHIDLLNQSIYY